MEATSSVSETVLAGCQLAEVLRGSGDGLIEEFKCYTSGGFRVHSNVKLKSWFSGALSQSIKQHIAHTKTLGCEDFGLQLLVSVSSFRTAGYLDIHSLRISQDRRSRKATKERSHFEMNSKRG